MIRLLIDMLRANEFYGQTENIETAKGKHKLYFTVKEKMEQQKRIEQCKKKQ